MWSRVTLLYVFLIVVVTSYRKRLSQKVPIPIHLYKEHETGVTALESKHVWLAVISGGARINLDFVPFPVSRVLLHPWGATPSFIFKVSNTVSLCLSAI